MMTNIEKRKNIYNQFIEQYIRRFNHDIALIPVNVPLAKALYMFAFTDYFGKIIYVADTGDISRIGSARHNFTYLIGNRFPAPHKTRNVEIYELYRCGIMHAVFPKGAGIHFLQGDTRLTFKDVVGITGQKYEIEVLNLWKYEELLKQAIADFSKEIETNDSQINNMYALLTNDIFGDATAYKKYFP
jgi:hypothetical protein